MQSPTRPERIVARPPVPADPPAFFVQRLSDLSGEAAWSTTPRDGVYQLLTAEVRADVRRRGCGSRLLEATVTSVRRHAEGRGVPLRRLIALVPQPQVVARAWLLGRGFVHVHTLTNVDADEEMMVLCRTFD